MNREKSPLVPLLDSHLALPAAMITRLLILFLLTATAAAQPRWEFVEAWGSETGRIIPLPDGTLLTSIVVTRTMRAHGRWSTGVPCMR